MSIRRISRRSFLSSAATTATGALVLPSMATAGAFAYPWTVPASDRITVGHIGVGGQGSGLLRGFLEVNGCQSVAVCDLFPDRRKQNAAQVDRAYAGLKKGGGYRGCTVHSDFRELLDRPDIDAVVVATPDHWHVPIALAAARAGKDMYVEKPLGLSIEQNKTLRSAIARYGAIFQYGTQQRSFNGHCAFACELVRNGYIGKILAIHVEAPAGESGGSTEPVPIPAGFDYDRWLGPAPESPYTADRCRNVGSYHVRDNSLGFIAGWGAHPLDVMHWGYPQIPVEYQGTGVIPREGLFTTVTNWNIRGRFADGVLFTFKDGPDKTTFVGEQGWVAASRAGIEADPGSLLSVVIRPDEIHLQQSTNHYQDFIESVRTRRAPSSPIASAVQSDFVSHLSEIAIRTGRTIRWDPVREEIIGDEQAVRLMRVPMRSPWSL